VLVPGRGVVCVLSMTGFKCCEDSNFNARWEMTSECSTFHLVVVIESMGDRCRQRTQSKLILRLSGPRGTYHVGNGCTVGSYVARKNVETAVHVDSRSCFNVCLTVIQRIHNGHSAYCCTVRMYTTVVADVLIVIVAQ
jgi:hypothetical protein